MSLKVLNNLEEEIIHKKPHVDEAFLEYKNLMTGEFWKKIPAYSNIDESVFIDHNWQAKNSIVKPSKLLESLQDLVTGDFLKDVEEGFRRAPMSIRVSLSLIDWEDPYNDPLRIQFIPVAS